MFNSFTADIHEIYQCADFTAKGTCLLRIDKSPS